MVFSNDAAVTQSIFVVFLLTLLSLKLVLCKTNLIFNHGVVFSNWLICIYICTQVISDVFL